MKTLLALIILILYVGTHPSNAQTCPSFDPNLMSTLPICGLYGDASGNSNWNWELTDKLHPSFCSTWYARTSTTSSLEAMGSPFVDGGTIPLDNLAQQQDFTRAKGWELLRRDFGCSQVAAYPYFVLYNKYTGLLRVFVYIPAGSENFEGIAVEIRPNSASPYPATTAFADSLQAAPDKFPSNTTPSPLVGLSILSVGANGGQGAWSMAEFNPSFDPNIQNFSGSQLQFTIYGVTNSEMNARIRGGSVTSQTPIYDYTYKPAGRTDNGNGTYDFKGLGQKFARIGTGVTGLRTEINSFATLVDNLMGNPSEILLRDVKDMNKKVKDATATEPLFLQSFGKLEEVVKGVSSFFKIFNSISGLIGGSGSGGPSYTAYDLTLHGTITTKVIVTSFVLRVPGTVQSDNNNATYYKCPMGIVNIKYTPQADKITYLRDIGNNTVRGYVSYLMKNNPAVSFNDGVGLDLVSAQAAIVGQVKENPDGSSTYDLFEAHGTYINHLRPDLENGRLEIKQYDPYRKIHVFQTPYVNLECLNGLAFNAPSTTNIFLQVKFVLKKKNDPSNVPIVVINNYTIETTTQPLSPQTQEDYLYNGTTMFPPYHNYTELPKYVSSYVFEIPFPLTSLTISGTQTVKADNNITTNSKNIIVNTGANVTFSAGRTVMLEPGFEAMPGSEFLARINDFGYTITCGTPLAEAYIYPLACYNTAVAALRTKPTTPAEESNEEGDIKIYPVPSPKTVYITGIKNHKNSTLLLIDQSGRTVRQLQINSVDAAGTISVDVSGLSNGVYFIKIQTPESTTTRKIIVGK